MIRIAASLFRSRWAPVFTQFSRSFGRKRLINGSGSISLFLVDGLDEEIDWTVPTERKEESPVPPQEVQKSDVQHEGYRATVLESQSELSNTGRTDWKSLKSSGLNDLEVADEASRVSKRQELLSHVPTETVVMKYGYVGPVVLDSV